MRGLLLVTTIAAVAACGSKSRPPPQADPTGTEAKAPGAPGSDPWTPVPPCAQETQYVYVIDRGGTLDRFDPPTLTMTPMGKIECPGSVFSMAVDRTAVAWVLFDDGTISRIDTQTGKCKKTDFVAEQKGFSVTFGMGFASNAPGSQDETLFVWQDGLARIDTSTLELFPIGAPDATHPRAELSGTGDGRLYGAFEADVWQVNEVDKTNATFPSSVSQPAIPTGPNSIAFAFWGGDFYTFTGPGTYTDVWRYRPTTGATEKVLTVPWELVGAGVSTCAPLTSDIH